MTLQLPADYEISTDTNRLNVEVIHAFLAQGHLSVAVTAASSKLVRMPNRVHGGLGPRRNPRGSRPTVARSGHSGDTSFVSQPPHSRGNDPACA